MPRYQSEYRAARGRMRLRSPARRPGSVHDHAGVYPGVLEIRALAAHQINGAFNMGAVVPTARPRRRIEPPAEGVRNDSLRPSIVSGILALFATVGATLRGVLCAHLRRSLPARGIGEALEIGLRQPESRCTRGESEDEVMKPRARVAGIDAFAIEHVPNAFVLIEGLLTVRVYVCCVERDVQFGTHQIPIYVPPSATMGVHTSQGTRMVQHRRHETPEERREPRRD